MANNLYLLVDAVRKEIDAMNLGIDLYEQIRSRGYRLERGVGGKITVFPSTV